MFHELFLTREDCLVGKSMLFEDVFSSFHKSTLIFESTCTYGMNIILYKPPSLVKRVMLLGFPSPTVFLACTVTFIGVSGTVRMEWW